MSAVCVCSCGQRWELPVDLVTFRGELALACPGCKRSLLRLLVGVAENAAVPPTPDSLAELATTPPDSTVDPDRTQPPRFGIDDEVEPEEVEEGLSPAQILRDYEIEGELGRGGMGIVYRAKHRGLNRLVALKMILSGEHAGSDEVARFRIEAEAIARLKHPNIVQVYDIRQQDGQAYFSLEFCGGGSLSSRLRGKPLVPKEAARVVEPLARAMQAVHDAGILHRDLKPANVLLTEDGTPKITDFGLAKKLDEAGQGKTRTGAVMGTPSYMAPEQA